MKLIDLTCPKCGAQLKVDASKQQVYCQYCGARLLVDDEIRGYRIDNAEDMGYQFEKGRQRAQQERQQRQIEFPIRSIPYQVKNKRKNTWLWVLGWILVFPLPLSILVWKSDKLKKGVKITIIIIAFLAYLLLGYTGASNQSSTTDTVPNDIEINSDSNSEKGTTALVISVAANEYAEDDVVNGFIKSYNEIAQNPLTKIEKGNIRTKYHAACAGYWLELLHANDTQAILVTINETDESAEQGVAGMKAVFHDIVKTIDPSILEEKIASYFENMLSGEGFLDQEFGRTKISYGPDVHTNEYHQRGFIKVGAYGVNSD